MGSRGTGRFTDYPGTSSGSAKGGGPTSSDAKGKAEVDQCEKGLGNVPLEEVARCEYFTAYHALPPIGMSVSVRDKLVGQRLGVEATEGKVLGLLPTEYNYLLQCMKQGYRYVGRVMASHQRPVPVVRVDLEPRK